MTQVILFTNHLGGVSVCTPTGELPIEKVKEKDTPPHSIIMDSADFPATSMDFFPAWKLYNGQIIVDIDRAKDAAKKQIRVYRQSLLANQDIAFQRALEQNQPTDEITREKQRLRDAPELIDSLETVESMQAIIDAFRAEVAALVFDA